jgi:glycogen(starch) synthase
MTAIAAPPRAPAPRATLQTLQLGMDWFGEKAGGLNRVYANLVEELSRDGVDLHGLVAGTPDVARASNGLVHVFAPSDAPLRARMRALRAAALGWLREHPDAVIASHFALNAFPVLTEVARNPLVVHFHGPWGQESRIEGANAFTVHAKELVERAVYARASHLIVLSTAFRDVLVERFRVPERRIHVIPGGVDVDRFAIARSRADCRRALGWPEGRPIVLCVRRLVRRVGVDTLVEAAVALRKRVPEALVLIAGRGPLKAELEARIVALGLANHVRLVGFISDEMLPTAYRAADLSVVPSTALEGFGLITVESLAAGTPCVVTPVGGLTDVVRPFAPQLVTGSPAAADVADVLARALLGEILLPTASHCAAYAREGFDWPVVAARVRDVYSLART